MLLSMFYLYTFFSIKTPKLQVHSFIYVPLYSTTPFQQKYNKLLQEKRECRDELTELKDSLKTIKDAVRLDSILPDKSQNSSMKTILSHYKEFFDEESGNTVEEGLNQLRKELSADYKFKYNKYEEIKKELGVLESNWQSSSFFIVFPINNVFFKLINIILPYVTLLISLVISVMFIMPNLELFMFMPDFIFDFIHFIQNVIKYEIILSLPIFIWSYYSFLRKIIKCINLGKRIYKKSK